MRLAATLTATKSIGDNPAVQMGTSLEQQPLARTTP
jgi:hypothetical protein